MAGMVPKKGSANANAAKPAAAKTAAPPEPKAVKAPKKEKAPSSVLGIGKFAKSLIAEGKTNEEVLKATLEKFPGANTKIASIAWYRNKMLKDGVKGVKHQSEIKAKVAKAEEKEAKAKAKESAEGLA